MHRAILILVAIAAMFSDIAITNQDVDTSLLFPVWSGRKCGYANRSGKVVIDPKFDICGLFSEGRASIKVGDKFGFIDRRGKIVVRVQYDEVFYFSEGLAAVKTTNKWGFV